MEYTYTIIIPHYNIPGLLSRCLRSIPQRDDLQVIVVDDWSEDRDSYPDTIPELHRPDVEFYVADKHAGGGHARNYGLQHAKGKYLIFADADDFFNICFGEILDEYKDSETDMIFFNANSVYTEDYTNCNRAGHLNRFISSYLSGGRNAEMLLRYSFGEPWSRIIRHSMVVENNIVFDETRIHNDTAFTYRAAHCARTIQVDKRAAYCITERFGSVSRQKSVDLMLASVDVFAKKNRFLIDNHIPFYDDTLLISLAYCQQHSSGGVFRNAMQIVADYGLDVKETKRKLFLYRLNRKYKTIKQNLKSKI